MSQIRILRDGTEGVANTIYIPKADDEKATTIAVTRNRKATLQHKRKTSKSQVLVEAVKKGLPKCA